MQTAHMCLSKGNKINLTAPLKLTKKKKIYLVCVNQRVKTILGSCLVPVARKAVETLVPKAAGGSFILTVQTVSLYYKLGWWRFGV